MSQSSTSVKDLAKNVLSGVAQAAVACTLLSQGIPPVDAQNAGMMVPGTLQYARARVSTLRHRRSAHDGLA